jgi:hypothetical protein
LNTLPNAPRRMAMPPISRKYIQPSPACESPPHRLSDRAVNIPPNRPTMITIKKMIHPAIAGFERIRFFFAS